MTATPDPTRAPTPASVLVVDPQAFSRNLMRHTLRRLGCRDVLAAGNAADALAVLERHAVATILIDRRMGEAVVTWLLRTLRHAPHGTGAPSVLVLAGRADRSHVERLVALGAHGVLVPPYSGALLAARMQTAARLAETQQNGMAQPSHGATEAPATPPVALLAAGRRAAAQPAPAQST